LAGHAFQAIWRKFGFLQLIYVKLGHTSSALIDLVADWA